MKRWFSAAGLALALCGSLPAQVPVASGTCLAKPSAAGPVRAALQPLVEEHILAGAVTLIATRDKVLDTESVGYAELATQRPMSPDDLFWIASMTKPMTATAFMMLVEEGKVSLDDTVQKYIPSFANVMVRPAKGSNALPAKPSHPLTLREILSHNSGLAFSAPEESPHLDGLPLSERVEAYARNPLLAQPGTEFLYANAGLNTIGRIIEIVSGMPYDVFLQKRILDPLGMTHTTFYPSAHDLACLAISYQVTPDKNNLTTIPVTQLTLPLDDRQHRFPIPAGGLFSTATDVLAFLQMLANDGSYHGTRLVTPSTVHQMILKQTSPATRTAYGLGFSVINNEFGHNGAYKTTMWVHPDTGLITIFLVQQSGHWAKDGDKRVDVAFKKAYETFAKDATPLTNDPVWIGAGKAAQ